ncbi:glutamate--cysteine ligase [Halobellus clavatus]|uniref:Glutamate--cysteine ligase n=1 Tax=Halobellus clavatus TaxID=660517 RepID=A0A1H3D2A7_9EURY|nr:glutamate--cysteine ligase [Halobellus clavatus]SDX59914.1 carboxylate-amine ligase [Halobellus clavatus]
MDLGSADAFDRMGTLGVEEEFYIVDERGRPTSGISDLVYDHPPTGILEDRIDHELFQFTIETQTPLIEDIDSVGSVVREVREALIEHAADHGYRIAAAGLHPAADWRELDHATKPRYQSQLDRIQYPQHRNTTAGLHIHVGVDDAEKATWIANELRWYLPPVLALSVNSPFWCGLDTGLSSARAKIFEALPNTGMPTRFEDFESYLEFERRMVELGSIEDRGELWYDVRPHTGHGTVEVRTPDAQSNPAATVDFVEYVYALVRDLADRYEAGESGHEIRRELLDANKWHAMRYGYDAEFITRDAEDTVTLAEFVAAESDRLPTDALRRRFDTESGAAWQRRLRDEAGMDALCEAICLD